MNTSEKNTILLIDPDVVATKSLADRLSSVGFNALTANDEDTALKLIEICGSDLILLDILMKGKNGLDMLTIMKSNRISAHIPVIIISSDADVNSKVYGFLSGANDYIVKPFGFPELLARINTQIRILNMQKELEQKNKELVDKNMLLQQMAITDALTNLYNRCYILDRLTGELSHSVRYKEPISFIMLDIDHFKKVNDNYGHLAGDMVLKEVSRQIKSSIRDADVAARYGGEEFLVVCPNTDVKGAIVVAERMRENIQHAILNIQGDMIHVTASFGISSILPISAPNYDYEVNRLIGNADIALYTAKQNGRNRIEVFRGGLYAEKGGSTYRRIKRRAGMREMALVDNYTH